MAVKYALMLLLIAGGVVGAVRSFGGITAGPYNDIADSEAGNGRAMTLPGEQGGHLGS